MKIIHLTAKYNKNWQRKYYLKNKTRIVKRLKKYRRKNKIKISQYAKVYYKKNKIKILSQSKIYSKKNRTKILQYQKSYKQKNKIKIVKNSAKHGLRYRLMAEYGLTVFDYNKMKRAQNNRCAICRKKKKLYVDHNHSSKIIRGLLCSQCNSVLGYSFDSKEILTSSIKYLTLKRKNGQIVIGRAVKRKVKKKTGRRR